MADQGNNNDDQEDQVFEDGNTAAAPNRRPRDEEEDSTPSNGRDLASILEMHTIALERNTALLARTMAKKVDALRTEVAINSATLHYFEKRLKLVVHTLYPEIYASLLFGVPTVNPLPGQPTTQDPALAAVVNKMVEDGTKVHLPPTPVLSSDPDFQAAVTAVPVMKEQVQTIEAQVLSLSEAFQNNLVLRGSGPTVAQAQVQEPVAAVPPTRPSVPSSESGLTPAFLSYLLDRSSLIGTPRKQLQVSQNCSYGLQLPTSSFSPGSEQIGPSLHREYLDNYFHLLNEAREIDYPFEGTRFGHKYTFGGDLPSRNNESLTEQEIRDVVSDFDKQLEQRLEAIRQKGRDYTGTEPKKKKPNNNV
jgi:hypothetical protein